MSIIKSFTEFKNDYLCTENYEVNQYQHMIKKVFKEIGVQLYFAATFGTALTVLIPLVDNMMKKEPMTIETKDIILLTIFVVSVLCKESKDKVTIVYNKLIETGIKKELIDKTVNAFRNIEKIFIEVALLLGTTIERFADMLVYTSIFVPFINIVSGLIDKNQFDVNILYQTADVFKITLGSITIKLLLNRIIKKLNIMLNHNDKFLNKDNVLPLLADQELKADMFKTQKFDAEKFDI